jgi:ribosomal protein L11 methyltransferase
MVQYKKWVEVSIQIDPSLLNVISNDVFTLGADGLEETNECIKIYFPDEQWNSKVEKSLSRLITKLNPEFTSSLIQTRHIPNQDWTESWKENFKLFHLTDNIIIKPDWIEYQAQQDEIVVTICPKMAFGTGHHETTQLVMLMLQKYLGEGQRLLDAGTGSGILAILAAQLGVAEITAFDNDPVAIENARENFSLNNIKIEQNIFCGTLNNVEISEYDIIVANIDRNVLLELPEKLIAYIKPGGTLILSGLLSRDEDKILTAYEEFNWQVIEKDQKGAWIVLALTHVKSG